VKRSRSLLISQREWGSISSNDIGAIQHGVLATFCLLLYRQRKLRGCPFRSIRSMNFNEVQLTHNVSHGYEFKVVVSPKAAFLKNLVRALKKIMKYHLCSQYARKSLYFVICDILCAHGGRQVWIF